MLLFTLMALGMIIVSSSMWLFGRLDQQDKNLFVELVSDIDAALGDK